jgi:hypothetical protein
MYMSVIIKVDSSICEYFISRSRYASTEIDGGFDESKTVFSDAVLNSFYFYRNERRHRQLFHLITMILISRESS